MSAALRPVPAVTHKRDWHLCYNKTPNMHAVHIGRAAAGASAKPEAGFYCNNK
jgi:hypothetical protein